MGKGGEGSLTLEGMSIEPVLLFSRAWTSLRGHRHDA